MNEYGRHCGDYIRDTVGLSMVEDGAYTRLLDQYYISELPLPNNKAELYRIARAASSVERKAVDYILASFFALTADGWRQARADKELEKIYARSEAARNSANIKWQKRREKEAANASRTHANADANASKSDATTHANAMRTACEHDATHYPLPFNPKGGAEEFCRTEGGNGNPATHPEGWPENLTRETWDRWKAHTSQKGKPVGGIQEKVLIARLCGYADPEKTILDAIAAGHKTLPPDGGWPSQQPRQSGLDVRAKVAADQYAHRTGESNGDRDITGEAKRVE